MTRGNVGTVLIVNPGADLYGSDRMALETVHALVADGRRVIVTVPETGPLVPLLEEAGAEVVVCPTPIIRKGLLNVRGLLGLAGETVRAIRPGRRLLKETGAGIVIVNTITPPLWLALSRLSRRHTICHVHEGEASVGRILQRALYLPLLFSNRIIINSRFSMGVLANAAPWLRARTEVVYNAVAGPPQVSPPRSSLDRPVRLLYVGRLSQRKGPHVAIDAVHRLLADGVDVRLSLLGAVFEGNEAYEAELREQVGRHGLEARVDFLGFQPSVWDRIAEADIVLIPSTVDEPFGNTAVEAALAARPAVVSDVGGLPEARSHSTSSVLVRPRDPRALADGIVSIIDDWTTFEARATADATDVAAVFSRTAYARGMLEAIERA